MLWHPLFSFVQFVQLFGGALSAMRAELCNLYSIRNFFLNILYKMTIDKILKLCYNKYVIKREGSKLQDKVRTLIKNYSSNSWLGACHPIYKVRVWHYLKVFVFTLQIVKIR